MNSTIINFGEGKYSIESYIVSCGKDLNIAIVGGDKHHIGAVSVASPTEKLYNGIKRSATTSVISLQDHKEDQLAYLAAKELATALDCVVAVSVGIHIDNVSMEDIKILNDNFMKLVEKIKKEFLKLK